MLNAFNITVAAMVLFLVIGIIAVIVTRPRPQLSTSEWLVLMRKHNLGTKDTTLRTQEGALGVSRPAPRAVSKRNQSSAGLRRVL